MIKMYTDDIINFVIDMVEKHRSEDEKLCFLNAAKTIGFLTDFGVRTYTRYNYCKHVNKCNEQFNQSLTKRKLIKVGNLIILIKTLSRVQF